MRIPVQLPSLLIALAAGAAFGTVLAQDPPLDPGPYAASTERAVVAMLQEAEVGPADFVIDLGSGDGRIVRAAALRFGARGMGVEIEDRLVALSNELARREGIAERVRFVRQDIFRSDLSAATVVTMYLLPQTVNRLGPKLLAELRPGARVVAHDYGLAGWVPHRRLEMDDPDKVAVSGVARTVIYVYVVPAQVAGTWEVEAPAMFAGRSLRLELTQELNRVTGQARLDGRAVPLVDAELVGERLTFRLPGREGVFRGRVSGERIEGMFDEGGARTPWGAARRG